MIHWRSKTDIIIWLEQHPPTRGVERALRSGGVVVLWGSFMPLPGSNSPGFIITVRSRAKRLYCIAIVVDKLQPPRAYLPDHVDWKTYNGGGCESKLYLGDMPCFAMHQKLNKVFEKVN